MEEKIPHKILTFSSSPSPTGWEIATPSKEEQHKFIEEHFSDLLTCSRTKNQPVWEADLFIYLWLYTHGGVYTEHITEEMLKEILAYKDDVVIMEDWGKGQRIYVSLPQQSIWLECAELLASGDYNKGYESKEAKIVPRSLKETKKTYKVIDPPPHYHSQWWSLLLVIFILLIAAFLIFLWQNQII